MRNKTREKKATDASNSAFAPREQDCYEEERLARLLKLIHGAIDSTMLLSRNSMPEKFWFKQQFAIGVNEVTRAVERMLPMAEIGASSRKPPHILTAHHRKPPPAQLQAILIASDCNPKWLTKHLPNLASLKKVPVIFVKDKKGGSLRLGELVKLKTAIAIGIKDKGNYINQIVEEVLHGNNDVNLGTECLKPAEMPCAPSVNEL